MARLLIDRGADLSVRANLPGHYERPGEVVETVADMKQSIVHIALIVRDYDEAIDFYVNKLKFVLVEDTYQPEQDKRWVVVSPPGSGWCLPPPRESVQTRTGGLCR